MIADCCIVTSGNKPEMQSQLLRLSVFLFAFLFPAPDLIPAEKPTTIGQYNQVSRR